jgi:hypothetical protein
MSEENLPTLEGCLEEIRTKPVVSPWPTLGVALGLSKGGTYDAMRRGDFETLRVGRLIKVICDAEERAAANRQRAVAAAEAREKARQELSGELRTPRAQ